MTYSSGSLEIVSASPPSWVASSGSWSSGGDWSPTAAHSAVGAGAAFSGSANTALTVTLDAPQTVGRLVFGNTGSTSTGYTLSGSTLTLNDSGTSTVTVLSGMHAISAPVEIAGGSLAVVVSSSGVLGISGNVSDDGDQRSLTLAGDGSGQLILSGSNNYGGGTTVGAGTLIVNNSAALPDGSSLTVGAGGTFIFDPSMAGAPAVALDSLPVSPGAGAAVPEPGILTLLGVAGIIASVATWRRRRNLLLA